MKKILFALFAALALAWHQPALAFDTPLTDPAAKDKIGTMGATYQRYAARLGYTDLAWANITAGGALYTMKYLQHGGTMAAAKSMVVITVYALSGVKDADDAKMNSTISLLEKMYSKTGTMVDDKVLLNPLDEKMLFTQFYYGEDPKTTYVAASYLRTSTTPSEAAFIQLQSSEAIPPEKALVLYQFVKPDAALPVKKKKAFDPMAPLTPEPESIAK